MFLKNCKLEAKSLMQIVVQFRPHFMQYHDACFLYGMVLFILLISTYLTSRNHFKTTFRQMHEMLPCTALGMIQFYCTASLAHCDLFECSTRNNKKDEQTVSNKLARDQSLFKTPDFITFIDNIEG